MSTSSIPKKPRRRRSFSPAFKAEAVRLATSPGRSVRQVAKELDLTESSLGAWVQQAAVDQRGSSNGALTTDERAELTRLRRELRVAQEERDFLKKAAAYFAKGQS